MAENNAEYEVFKKYGFSFEAYDNLRKLAKMVDIKEYMRGIDRILCYSIDSISDDIPLSYAYRISLPIVEALYNYLILPYESSYLRVPVATLERLISKVDCFCNYCEKKEGNVFESPTMLIREILDEDAEKEDSTYIATKRLNVLKRLLEDCRAKSFREPLTEHKEV